MTQTVPHVSSRLDLVTMASAVAYDPIEGTFTWKYRVDQRPQWNGRCAGKPCGCVRNKDKYLIVTVNSIKTYGHILAGRLHKGEVAEGYFVDHIDGNPLNNTLGNLRLASMKQSSYNTKSAGGTSEYKGVYRATRSGKFVAQITIDAVNISLGTYLEEEVAAGIYNWVAHKVQGEFCKLNTVCKVVPTKDILDRVYKYTGQKL